MNAIAAKPTTAAAIASPVSSPLMVCLADATTGRGAGEAGRAAGAAATEERGAPAGGGETLAGAELGRGAGAPGGVDAGAGVTAGPAEAGAAPAGTEGNLIVALGLAAGGGAPTALGGTGPAPGFGGKLIRTVSFFGWTLALSAGLGGMPEGGGGTGLLSAINLLKP